MKALFALAAVLSAAAGIAGTTSLYDDGLPPARYKGDATVTVQFVDDIRGPCGFTKPPANGGRYMACTLPDGQLVMPNPCAVGTSYYAQLMCHELGHHNGWPGNHPRP